MQFGMWDTLFNLVLLLFWTQIWDRDRNTISINPILDPVLRIRDTALDYLRPVLPFLAPHTLAAVVVAFLLVFRGLAVPPKVSWAIHFGLVSTWAKGAGLLGGLLMSALSFAVFLFKLWTISLIYVHSRRAATLEESSDALYQASRPFTDLPTLYRPPVLLILGTLLAWTFTRVGMSPQLESAATASGPVGFIRLLAIALAGGVAVLPVIQKVLILLIIGSFVSIFTGSQSLAMFCRTWIDLLVGPLRRYPLRLGMLDLTPLIFMFALSFVYSFLMSILVNTFQALS